jgi:V/A-type H+-transporting ATPase subunit K
MNNLTRLVSLVTILVAVLALGLTMVLLQGGSAGAAEGAVAPVSDAVKQWAMLSAAISAGLATLGAGYAVAGVGAAAVGALAEKPELFGRLLVLVGLAEGIAIYGLIVAILILNRAG